MDDPFAVHQSLHVDVGTEWLVHECCELFRIAERRQRVEMLTVIGRQGTDLGAAKPVRLVQDLLEHWRDVTRRVVDGVHHLGERGLTGQRFVALGRRLIQISLRFVQLGSAFGKLTLQIGYEPVGIG